MKIFKKKVTKIITLSFISIVLSVVLILSLLSLHVLISPYDKTLSNGQKISQRADEVRKRLLARTDISQVSFNSQDNIKLSGLLIKRNNAFGNILICHGYQSCKEMNADFIDIFPQYNILLFDFRAHGQSGGKFRTLGCYEHRDVVAAAKFLKENTKSQISSGNKLPFIILGLSMGGSCALKALEYEPNLADALIIDSAFYSLNEIIYITYPLKSGLPSYPFLPIISNLAYFVANCDVKKMTPLDSVKKTNKPILFIHSSIDKIVPPEHSLIMFAYSTNEKNKIWITPKCHHGKSRIELTKQYKKKVENFLKKVFA